MTVNSRCYDGTLFLEDIEKKLKHRLVQLDKELDEGQKEIENMHEYYWENYTEMDQYGYEEYDNQQALLQQTNANEAKLKQKHRFPRMLDAPFFCRVDFIFDGEYVSEPFYIVIGSFADKSAMTSLVYAWRGPCKLRLYLYG